MRDYVTRDELDEQLAVINRRITEMGATQQAEIDTLTSDIDQVATDLAAAQTTLQNELNALAAANPQLDFSKLEAAVAPLDSAVKALGALTPQAPAPAPAAVEATQPPYTFGGDATTIVAADWPAATDAAGQTLETVPAAGGTAQALYYYSGDAAGSGQTGTANGNGLDSGAWAVWAGAVQAVPASG